ncbi:hypothetical protein D9M71_176830 [compost metagenome]
MQRIAPQVRTALQHLDAGFAVGRALGFLHQDERLAIHHARAAQVREVQLCQRRGDGLVALGDAPLAEQRLVGRAAGGVGGEQHQPGGEPVDAVQRHQQRVVQAPGQARQQGLLDVLPGRGDRQEVRLVRHHQVLVHMQDRFDEGNRRFLRHLAEIVDAQAFPVGRLRADRPPLGVQHAAAGHAVEPGLAGDGREMRAQAVEHRGPGAGGQMQGTGALLRGGEGSGHGATAGNIEGGH